MENGIDVILYEKQADGELKQIDERRWSANMLTALDHVNYVTIGGQEYETIEGRLNLDLNRLELLVVRMKNA